LFYSFHSDTEIQLQYDGWFTRLINYTVPATDVMYLVMVKEYVW